MLSQDASYGLATFKVQFIKITSGYVAYQRQVSSFRCPKVAFLLPLGDLRFTMTMSSCSNVL